MNIYSSTYYILIKVNTWWRVVQIYKYMLKKYRVWPRGAIKNIDLTAFSIDVMQNLSVISYEKSSDFYECEV